MPKIRKIAGWRSRVIGLLRANPSPETVRTRRVIAKESNLSPIGGRRDQNLLATFGKAPKKSTSRSGPGVAGAISGQNPENRGMAISSHRPFKGQPVSGICLGSPSNRERIESQPDWWPESPKSLSDLRKTTPGVEIWFGAKGGWDQIWPRRMVISTYRVGMAKAVSGML